MIVVSGDSFTEKGHHLSWHDHFFPKLHKKFIPLIFKQWIDQNNLQGSDGHHQEEEGQRLFAEEIKKFIN